MKPPLTFDKPIAWVCRTVQRDGKTEVEVIRKGMNKAEILAAFPPPPTTSDKLDYARKDLIKAIIYEAYTEARRGYERRRQNIRGFWYERIMHTLLAVMGEKGDEANIDSINSSINAAWRDLVEDGHVTYTGLSLYSEKENGYHIAVREDSPYPTTIVLVEKAALYDVLHDIATTYEISFCCTGGQNSRAAAMAYTTELENKGIDLSEDFTVYSFCDFDPEGWDIPETFVNHLKLRVTGEINLVRLGVLKEKLGESTISRLAVPYPMGATTSRARKSKETKYGRFAALTGGLFIPDSDGNLIPGRIELNIYDDEQIREMIIEGLAEHIDGFLYQARVFKEEIERQYQHAWDEIVREIHSDADDQYQEYYDIVRKTLEQIETQKSQRATNERLRLSELEKEMRQLWQIIGEKTRDLSDQQERLRNLRMKLERDQERETDYIIEQLQNDKEIIKMDQLIEDVEKNGGWRDWAEELNLNIIDGKVLSKAARNHRRLFIQTSSEEDKRIEKWIKDKMEDTISVDIYPDGPDEDPDELIERILNGDDDDDDDE